MLPALVLTAGLGTRLRPLTLRYAKPAVPLAGEPLVRRILAALGRQGVTDVVLNLHHHPETVAAAVGDGSDLGLCARYSWEQPAILGSAGGIRHALDLLGTPSFLVVNGDTLTDFDLHALVARHEASDALVTLALVPNRMPDRYGGAVVDADGYVSAFVGRGPGAAGSWHFVGLQVVSARVVSPLADNTPMNSIGGAYDRLLRERPRAIAACCTDARFWDIGTPADYLSTALTFAADERRPPYGRNVVIDPGASIVDSVLWDDVTVERGAVVTRSIVGDGVRIGRGSRYEDAIIMNGPGGLSVTPIAGR